MANASPQSRNGCKLLSPMVDGQYRLSHVATKKFIEQIVLALDDGKGFLPIVGAGCSAQSGLPLIRELTPYLVRCVGMALGVGRSDLSRRDGGNIQWNPRTDQWPDFMPTTADEANWWRSYLETFISDSNSESPKRPDLHVFKEGRGALSEWRTALQFLSRLKMTRRMDEKGDLQNTVSLAEPSQDVIDAFVRAILKGRQPTLSHRMLAALAAPLRLDVLLTTNFDELLEDAFSNARNPLTVFDVHLSDSLPAWSAVTTQRSLIKLHGNSYSVRADYSLDTPASEPDLLQFSRYLSGSVYPVNLPKHFRYHILVIGVSANEARTLSLIERAWREYKAACKVFWICYSDADVNQTMAKLGDICPGTENEVGAYVLRHSNPGLLFLQLYQAIRHTIPATGVVFPSPAKLSLPPLRQSAGRMGRAVSECRHLLDTQIKKCLSPKRKEPRLTIVTSLPDAHGLTSLCADVFEQNELDAVSIWVDLNDITTTDDLFEHMLDAMYNRLGSDRWLPVHVAKDIPSKVKEIRRLAVQTSAAWLFYINARETPGSNHSEDNSPLREDNGWVDSSPNELVSFLTQLCSAEVVDTENIAKQNSHAPIIGVVLSLRTPDGARTGVRAAISASMPSITEIVLKESANAYSPAQIAKDCIKWASTAEKRKFLLRLALMQRTRFPTSLWDTCDAEQNIQEHARQSTRWLDELAKLGLVRYKLGGFIWVQSVARFNLRVALKKRRDSADSMPEVHWSLAHWYIKVLASTNTPLALFEATDHALKAAAGYIAIEEHDMARQCITWATHKIRANEFLVQTAGNSRGNCRRLERLRDQRVRSCAKALGRKRPVELYAQLRNLQLACTDTLRAIAREVGDLKRAYARHRERRAIDCLSGSQLKLWDFQNSKPWPAISKFDHFRTIMASSRSSNPQRNILEWLRWHRWSGMLGIASRCFDGTTHVLNAAITVAQHANSIEVGYEELCGERKGAENGMEKALKSISDRMRHPVYECGGVAFEGVSCEAMRTEIVRVSEQYIASQLHEHSIALKLHALLPSYSVGRNALSGVGKCIDYAIAIIQSGVDSTPQVSGSWGVLMANRLLLHRSQLATFKGQYENALRLCGDADRMLNTGQWSRLESDRAIVELYRADARLIQAGNEIVSGGKTLEQVMRLCCDRVATAIVRSEKTDALAEVIAKGDYTNLNRARAYVEESSRFLERAEAIFSRRRRNSAWTTWYYHRRLQSISYAVWLAIVSESDTIPFIGKESTPEGMQSIPEAIVDIAESLIRDDSYRLAAISDAYMQCMCAIIMLQCAKEEASWVGSRRSTMQSRFVDLARSLNQVHSKRMPGEPVCVSEVLPVGDTTSALSQSVFPPINQDKCAAVTQNVDVYINRVMERNAIVLDRLRLA